MQLIIFARPCIGSLRQWWPSHSFWEGFILLMSLPTAQRWQLVNYRPSLRYEDSNNENDFWKVPFQFIRAIKLSISFRAGDDNGSHERVDQQWNAALQNSKVRGTSSNTKGVTWGELNWSYACCATEAKIIINVKENHGLKIILSY